MRLLSKKWRCLIKEGYCLLIAFIVMVFLYGCDRLPQGYSYDSPEKTFESMLRAVANKDIDAFLDTVTEEYLQQNWNTTDRLDVRNRMLEAFRKASTQPRRPEAYEVVNKVEKDSFVRIEYRLKASHQEENKPFKAVAAYLMKRVGSEWKIYALDSNLNGDLWQYTRPENPFEIIKP